jgi:hypothetical protein
VAGLRLSHVLSNKWWEAVDFDLDLSENEQAKTVRVHGVAHISVCDAPLGSLTRYQGLDDAQKTVYAAKLDSEVAQALRTSCKTYVQHDAKTIACN